jgi:ATP-dependent exoDNAse (exonuclease V) alpha subunit
MNTEQRKAYELFQQGHNVLLTGSAGTGKSFTLKHIIEWEKANNRHIGITASTGLAAYLIKGRTIHSFLRLGLGKDSASKLVQSMKTHNKLVYKKAQQLNSLIIDEVSMLNAEFLDKLSEVLGLIRGNTQPFGGVQMLLCGDFCQLPPVSGDYCFLGEAWKKADMHVVVLKELVRQDGDELFKKILESLRYGKCDKRIYNTLRELKNTVFENGVQPTRLYSLNVNVDKINNEEYEKLKESGKEHRDFKTIYSSHQSTRTWADTLKIPETLEVCVGSQVVVTWNTDAENNIVNGTRGVVTGFDVNGVTIRLINGRTVTISRTTVTCEDNDKITVSFMPLRLAYALTIHKSQGMTLDAVEMDLGKSIFEYGQAYTALSRAKSLKSVKLVAVDKNSFKTHPCVLEFYEKCSRI